MQHANLHGQVEFPTLNPGLTVLEMEERAVGALQSLVLDHLLLGEGTACWVDSRNNAITTMLTRLAPSKRILERVSVARGFTPFQHYSIVDDLTQAVDSSTELVVLPDIEWLYAKEDLHVGEGEQMLTEVLETLHELGAGRDIPILVSIAGGQGFDALVDGYADDRLTCELTQFGPRFSGSDFETLVFECDDGWVQTTLAFWKRVLQSRHPALEAEHPTGVTTVGSY